MSIYCVEVGKNFSGNLQRRGLKILAKMLDGGCARNQQASAEEAKRAQAAWVWLAVMPQTTLVPTTVTV
jgi:hypothetical protein